MHVTGIPPVISPFSRSLVGTAVWQDGICHERFRKTWLLFLLLGTFLQLKAQDTPYSGRREILVPANAGMPFVCRDSQVILRSSVRVRYSPEASWVLADSLEVRGEILRLWVESPHKIPLAVAYQVLPKDWNRIHRHKDSSLMSESLIGPGDPKYSPGAGASSLFQTKGLDYHGSFSRGLVFGNNQNLVLNSQFNLQMNGEIGDGIRVQAAITDNNIPIQPEGNTRQLQDFDRVFIQLQKGRHSLTAGDYEIQEGQSHFMRYYKKLQGLTYRWKQEKWGGSVSFAASRGKFSRHSLSISEGNQGPYLLNGADGERFIIVLAGTERIFWNGELLSRGSDQDYVMDYNTGSITFTPRRLVVNNVRIICEFEYVIQQYARSLVAADIAWKGQGSKAWMHIFSEQDARNSSGLLELSETDKKRLANAGDEVRDLLVSGVDTLASFDRDRVLYTWRDTMIQGIPYQFLQYSADPGSARLAVVFTEVGPGKGHYRLSSKGINGRIYEWVAPDPLSGQLQGSFEPVKRLNAPLSRQLLVAGGELGLGRKFTLSQEIGFSHLDLNRFSGSGNRDNLGLSSFTRLGRTDAWGQWKLEGLASYEFVQDRFRYLNFFREAEFNRQWSVSNPDPADEHLGKLQLKLSRQRNHLAYEGSGFLRREVYSGIRHRLFGDWALGRFRLKGDAWSLASREETEEIRFLNVLGDLSYQAGKQGGQLGLTLNREKNRRERSVDQQLASRSLYFDELTLYYRLPDTVKNPVSLHYRKRWDYLPGGLDFRPWTRSDEVMASTLLRAGKTQQVSALATFRNLQFPDSADRSEKSLLGRVLYDGRYWKDLLRTSLQFELSGSREQKLEYVYEEVQAGTGTHQWVDLNGDGIRQNVEFLPANFQDQANYIRLTFFTNNFVPTRTAQLNGTLFFQPRQAGTPQTKWRAFLNRLSTQHAYNIQRKVIPEPGGFHFNPFRPVADTALISGNSSIRNTLQYVPASNKFDIQLSQLALRNILLLTTGREDRREASYQARGRYNWGLSFSSSLEYQYARSRQDALFLPDRNYRIDGHQVSTDATWLPTRSFRLVNQFKFERKENRLGSLESLTGWEWKVSGQYNQASRTSFQASVSLARIRFDGKTSSQAGFLLLKGLQPGQNFLWNIAWVRRVGRNLQFTLAYDGRKTGENRTIHTGSTQLRATF